MIENWRNGKRIGIFGDNGLTVIILHGGPGASGGSEPIAMELSDTFKTYSPWQRTSGDIPLSVDIHVEDLKDLIELKCQNEKPALVGESWGAMLALSFASKYPTLISSISLIGCGTYSVNARQKLIETRRERINDFISKNPQFIEDLKLPFRDQTMKWHGMTDTFCAQEELPVFPVSNEEFDVKGFEETWNDMLVCQQKGIYPADFINIRCPVIMIHGEYDPHPGKMTFEQLKEYMPQLEYKEFEKCGHSPSIEKFAREEFFCFLKNWILDKFTITIPNQIEKGKRTMP